MEFRKNKTRLSLIIISTVLLLIVMGFTGVLNILSFRENCSDSLVSSYYVLGRETAGRIEYALKYGKPLDSFWEMDKYLQQITSLAPEIYRAQIVLPDGQVLYDQQGSVADRQIPAAVVENPAFQGNNGADKHGVLIHKGQCYLFIPILDRDREWVGSLNITFDDSIVDNALHTYVRMLLLYLLLLAGAGLTILLLATSRLSFTGPGGRSNKKFIAFLLVLLGFLQIMYGVVNYSVFRQAYLETALTNTAAVGRIIKTNVDRVLAQGVPYTELNNIEDYFLKILTAVPELENIHITDTEQEPLYSARRTANSAAASRELQYTHVLQLADDARGQQAAVRLEISEKSIAGKLRRIFLDTATVVIISFIMMVEVTLFVFSLPKKKSGPATSGEDWAGNTLPVIRCLSFLIFTVSFMSASFIPLVMKTFNSPLTGLPPNIILGLPISAEMFWGALAAFGAGRKIDQQGYRPVLLKGIAVFGGGTLISALAWDAFSFIAGRSVVGIGFGLVLTALRTMVVSAPDLLLKNQGVAAMNSGAYAGMNCGIVIGAMLADRIGYANVFFAALGLIIISWRMAAVFTEKVCCVSSLKGKDSICSGIKLLLFNKQVLVFFSLTLLPLSMAGMFINYLFPLFADSIGVSSSTISRAVLFNGLLIIYAGPVLSRYSEKHLGTRKSVAAALLITSIALFVFALYETLASAYITVILLGLAESFGAAAQNTYFLGLNAVRCLGEGKAVAWFGLMGKMGQMLGPLVYGFASILGMTGGTGLVGVIAVLACALFVAVTKDKPDTKNLARG